MIQIRNFTACLAVLAALCGCGKTEPVAPPTTTPLAATGEPASVLRTEDSVAGGLPTTKLAAELQPTPAQESPITESTADTEKLAADYEPPFPDRVHLFLAPKREGKSTGTNDQEEAVELLGFVNVRDNHKAVLSINGAVYPVAEGDSQFGVEVISIQPPGVVLQRGRQRWQASLEN